MVTRDERSALARTLLSLEERFWTGDATFYRENLTTDFRMVFPGMGVLNRQSTIEGIAGGARWDDVEILDARVAALAEDVAMLSYRARARRGEEAYSALVSSAYARRGAGWKLAFHHQSPIEAPSP